jgi:hypothetical protein
LTKLGDVWFRRFAEVAQTICQGIVLRTRSPWHGRLTVRNALESCPSRYVIKAAKVRAQVRAGYWRYPLISDRPDRIFQFYADIVALCCEAWNKLIERPWKITSIGMREWAHGSDQCKSV